MGFIGENYSGNQCNDLDDALKENERLRLKNYDSRYTQAVNDRGESVVIYDSENRANELNSRIKYYNMVTNSDILSQLDKENSFVIIAENTKGSNKTVGPDTYDDRITIVMRKDGKLVMKEFTNANMEPSLSEYGKGHSVYEKKINSGSTTMQRFNNGDPTDLRKYTYDGKKEGEQDPYIAVSIDGGTVYLVHAGGKVGSNDPEGTYSKGCLTIAKDDYREFMDMFGEEKIEKGKTVWDFSKAVNGSYSGSVYVIR